MTRSKHDLLYLVWSEIINPIFPFANRGFIGLSRIIKLKGLLEIFSLMGF